MMDKKERNEGAESREEAQVEPVVRRRGRPRKQVETAQEKKTGKREEVNSGEAMNRREAEKPRAARRSRKPQEDAGEEMSGQATESSPQKEKSARKSLTRRRSVVVRRESSAEENSIDKEVPQARRGGTERGEAHRMPSRGRRNAEAEQSSLSSSQNAEDSTVSELPGDVVGETVTPAEASTLVNPVNSSGIGNTANAVNMVNPEKSALSESSASTEGATDSRASTLSKAAGSSEGSSGVAHDPDSKPVHGILEVMGEGFGFIRSENFLPGEQDVYVNPQMIRRYGLKTGDMIQGFSKSRNPLERYGALMFIETLNGLPLFKASRRVPFEKLTPIFPNERLHLEVPGEKAPLALRVLDLLAPIGKGQRGMIVSPPKAGKTTLLKQVAKAIVRNEPQMHLLILLIDERPEEVTDMKEEVEGGLVQVIYSTFDETPENHKRVAEMTIERAKRLVEQGEDVTILLDSITRLARAYNLTVQASGRTLSGGLDPAALHPPKKFFGAARNMREHGSLTILATALVDTGSRMDDVIYEEFKGTGNMELVLNRELQERRIFPAIDIQKSGTRRDDLLLSELEKKAVDLIHRELTSDDKKNSVEEILDLFERSERNEEVCEFLVNRKPLPTPKILVKVNKR